MIIFETERQDGGYTTWSEWKCPVNCGTSKAMFRERSCTNPVALNGGSPCAGPSIETKEETCIVEPANCNCGDIKNYCSLNTRLCFVYPRWEEFTQTDCNATCMYCGGKC